MTQVDIARAAVEATETVAPVDVKAESAVEENTGEATKSTPTLVEEKDEIRLMFSANEKEPFQYKVNGSDRTIEPGEIVLMEVGKQWKIEFDAGGELGGREAILNEGGVFAFEKTDTQGWVLMKNPETQTATPDVSGNGDNSGN